jgi:hypothetical protein
MDNPFIIACKNGNLIEAQRIYNYDNDLINDAFLGACSYGHFHIVVWLYYLKDVNIHINFMNCAFSKSCINNHFNIAEWLYTVNNKIDVHYDNYAPFIYACLFENLEFAKWLYNLNDNKPNLEAIIFAYTNAYAECCTKIEKWLCSLIDLNEIRKNNDYIFKKACENNNKNAIEFLITICNNYEVEYNKDDKIVNWEIKI